MTTNITPIEALKLISQGSCKHCTKSLHNGGKCVGGDRGN